MNVIKFWETTESKNSNKFNEKVIISMKNNEMFKGKDKNLSFSGTEILPLNLNGFKVVFKGEVKLKGFSSDSRVGAHHLVEEY